MARTIAEDKWIYKMTDGKPLGDDFSDLFETLFDSSKKAGYPLEFGPVETTDSTFHPLRTQLTIQEASQRYMRERERSISPEFIYILEKVKEFNRFCSSSSKSEYKIKDLSITDFMNFMYLADNLLEETNYRDKTERRGILRRREVEVADKNPIVILSNPKADGLVEALRPALRDLGAKNRAVRMISLDSNVSALDYSALGIEDIQVVNAGLKDNSRAEFGVFSHDGSIFGRFIGQTDLLGVENKIDAKFVDNYAWDYNFWLIQFNAIKKS
jgi:hypothetical protein